MSSRRTVSPVDTIWLNMDRPNNLMVIEGVMWFDGPIDWPRFVAMVQRRIVDRYPVFRERPVPSPTGFGLPQWEVDDDFDIENQIVRVTLPEPGGEAELQAYVSDQMHRPLNRDRPLWEMHLIDGYGSGSAIMSRFHHALADGIALAAVLLSMTDETPTEDLEEAEWPDDRARHRGGLFGAVGAMGGAAVSLSGSAVRGGLHMAAELPRLIDPATYVDAAVAAEQSTRVAGKLLLSHNPPSSITGAPGLEKTAVWSSPLPIGDVKRIGHLMNATVNDVLVAALAGAIRTYAKKQGDDPRDLTTMVPVNLRPLDQPLPRELGNRFALVLLLLPTGHRGPLARLAEAKRRMDYIKGSPEPVLTFGLISGIGYMPRNLERLLVDFFSSKAIGVTTNVQGPNHDRYVAGTKLVGVLGWVPGSGLQSLGVCIISYSGMVRIGFKTDAKVITDPQLLVDAFDDQMADLGRIAARA